MFKIIKSERNEKHENKLLLKSIRFEKQLNISLQEMKKYNY